MKPRIPKGLLTTPVRYVDVTCDEVRRRAGGSVSPSSVTSVARFMYGGATALHFVDSDRIRVLFDKPRVEGRP